jgi:hypothetical protein
MMYSFLPDGALLVVPVFVKLGLDDIYCGSHERDYNYNKSDYFHDDDSFLMG